MSVKNKLFKEMFRMFPAAAQQASMKARRTSSVAGSNPTQPMGQPNPWTTLTELLSVALLSLETATRSAATSVAN